MIINEQPKRVTDVVATMAIEDMYLSREFVDELVKVANGKRTSESLRQEAIKYHRCPGIIRGRKRINRDSAL